MVPATRDCGSSLCRDARKQMAAHTMQCNVISPEHTNKQDLTFKNHPEVVSDDFLGDIVAR